MVDSGVEDMFAVSLASLRINAPEYWSAHPKLIFDFGFSPKITRWLQSLEGEKVYVRRLSLPECHFVAGTTVLGGIGVMYRRMEIMSLAPSLVASWNLPVESFIVCDADTVFLTTPEEFPIFDKTISIMKEWDIVGGQSCSLRLCRPSSFRASSRQDDDIATIAEQLSISESTLREIPTFNSGVIGFRAGTNFTNQWRIEYDALARVVDSHSEPIFSPYAAEQNALALAIHKGTVSISNLPRRFNQFPPRPPSEWPAETVIAHFITFHRNHLQTRYDLWRDMKRRTREANLLPIDLI